MKRSLLLISSLITFIAFESEAQLTMTASMPMCNAVSNGGTVNVVTSPSNAVSYSWQPAGGGTTGWFPILPIAPNGSAVALTFSGCGFAVISCSAYATSNVFITSSTYTFPVSCSPTLTASGNTIICQGTAATLACFGAAVSYTWLPPGGSGATATVSPMTSTVYTVIAASSMGCLMSLAIPVIVMPSPTLTAGNATTGGTICSGSAVTLTVGGASSYVWSNSAVLAAIVVSPLTSQCYSVVGTGSNGCTSSAVVCVSVTNLPNVNVSGSNTVCLGSSVTLTATGALSYTWNTNPVINTATANVLPSSTTNYIVSGLGSNGCIGQDNITVSTLSSCAMVWPGDANSDGVVSSLDVLEIGLAFSSTGPARTATSNAYSAQYASAWTGTVSSGKNLAHGDCDGSGTINLDDTLAITNNFLLTHAFKTSSGSGVPELKIVPEENFIHAGAWNKSNIILGDASNPVNQLYGITFDINFDQNMIENNSAYLVYTPSFLNVSGQNVQFRKNQFSSGRIYAASVRTNHNNVSGNGKIAEFYYKAKTGQTENAPFQLSLANVNVVGNTGVHTGMTGNNVTQLYTNAPSGISEVGNAEMNFGFYPNPASGSLMLWSGLHTTVSYSIYDLTGRKVISGEFTGTKSVDISKYAFGSYLLAFSTANGTFHKKLIIE